MGPVIGHERGESLAERGIVLIFESVNSFAQGPGMKGKGTQARDGEWKAPTLVAFNSCWRTGALRVATVFAHGAADVFNFGAASRTQTLPYSLAMGTARRKKQIERCPPGALGDDSKPSGIVGCQRRSGQGLPSFCDRQLHSIRKECQTAPSCGAVNLPGRAIQSRSSGR